MTTWTHYEYNVVRNKNLPIIEDTQLFFLLTLCYWGTNVSDFYIGWNKSERTESCLFFFCLPISCLFLITPNAPKPTWMNWTFLLAKFVILHFSGIYIFFIFSLFQFALNLTIGSTGMATLLSIVTLFTTSVLLK